jgi:hypothetical protein
MEYYWIGVNNSPELKRPNWTNNSKELNDVWKCFTCYVVPVIILLLFTFIVDEIISIW